MQIIFKVIRQDPTTALRIQAYALDVDPSNTILDCLNQIKWEQDGTLAFRKNCRNTICGSCSMRINGRSALACKENVGSELKRLEQSSPNSDTIPEITVAPMGNMPVIKDLVVDMQSFWRNLKAIDPYVSTAARQVPEREFLQTPEERSRLNQSGNCILCGACYSECNAREFDPSFVGPHALAKAYRMVADTRDAETENRLEAYNQGTAGVWGCTRCYYCNAVCPMEVAPLDQIGKIKNYILQRKDDQASRSIRHRKVLIELVKQGGWIDERLFGLKVVGNSFRDLRGILSLAPLGVRMIARRKFPGRFEASEGTATVRSLIESVKGLDQPLQFELASDTPEPVGG
ncbi:succinate dehydrogenase/fumarate reductase iron-sulfur subunit [Pantanalinema rosaneae CENA516]|uniref:succinate dehydrogenase/fumarate reductase iron-sulfur subunit n=1 Tax=Pantanalinema rosaneae TaxID=1620701 RepID=UPI003D6EF841